MRAIMGHQMADFWIWVDTSLGSPFPIFIGMYIQQVCNKYTSMQQVFDEELESISLMDEDLEVLPLEPMLAPSRAPPPVGEGAIL